MPPIRWNPGRPPPTPSGRCLRARARAFTAALGDGEVVYASKAFPCTAVLRVFAENTERLRGLLFDVVAALPTDEDCSCRHALDGLKGS